MRKSITVFFVFVICNLKAQVVINYNNQTIIDEKGYFKQDFKNSSFLIASLDTNKVIARESADMSLNGTTPFRFAEPVKTDIDVVKKGDWSYDSVYAYCKFKIEAEKAKSLSINFDHFYLPKGTEMYVYNDKGKMIAGPVSELENNKDSTWGSTVYMGSILIIELKIPKLSMQNLRLHISNIAQGYKEIFSTYNYGGLGGSASCEINVLCPPGNNWAPERNSVCLILNQNGSVWCSGAMVNNTCSINLPYVLTANHALNGGSENVGLWRFIFQYWSPQCTPTQDNSSTLLFNGSALRSNSSTSDFALLQLNQTPPANSNITFAGWDRSGFAASSTVSIHHPEGDVMKIAIDANPPQLAAYNASPFNTLSQNWWAVHFLQGTVEPGSSGSPLFNQNHKIIGQLTGDPSNPSNFCARQFGEYGRFDLSWIGGGTDQTRLSTWLDPINTNTITTATTNISALTNVNLAITGNTLLCNSESYSINTTLPVTWSCTPNLVSFSCTSCNTTVATLLNTGYGTITATINTGCGAGISASKIVSVGSPVTIVSNVSSTCSGTYQTWSLIGNPQGNGTNWNWTVSYLSQGSSINIYNGNTATPVINVSGSGGIKVNYVNLCGLSRTDGITVYSSCHAPAMISPNPSNGIVTLSTSTTTVNQSNSKPQIASLPLWKIYQVQVLNKDGALITKFNYSSGVTSARIDLGNILNGNYILRIFDNECWTSQQLIIIK